MKQVWSVLSVAGVLLLAGCDNEFTAPPPALTAPPSAPAVPISTVTVALAVPATEVAKLANTKIAARLVDLHDVPVKCAIGTCKLTLSATRTGPIAVVAAGGALKIDVPFLADATLTLPGMLSGLHTEAHVHGRANVTAAPTLGGNWQVQPHISGTMDLQNSRMRLGPLDTDLSAIWNFNADRLSQPVFRMIDQAVGDSLHEAPQVAKLWNAAFAPIKVSGDPAAWIVLQPERIRTGAIATANNALYFSLGVDVRAKLVVQDAPPTVKPAPLPQPAPMNGSNGRFRFSVPVVLSYDTAAKLALDNLTKHPPRVGSHTLKVTKLAILPSGQDVVVQATFCIEHNWDAADMLSGCGTGYLRGVPKYDVADQSIRIDGLHYDMQTEDLMMHVMNSLAGPALGRELEKGFTFDVSKALAKMQRQISSALAKPQGRDILVSGTVDRFGTPNMTWSKDGFVALMPVDGTLKAELHL